MGARRGSEAIEKLKTRPIELRHRGQRVAVVTAEPGLSDGVRSLAVLYNLQWQARQTMLFAWAHTGAPGVREFLRGSSESPGAESAEGSDQ